MLLLVAKKEIGVVKIISHFFHPSAIATRCSAAVPLDNAVQYFEPNFELRSEEYFHFHGHLESRFIFEVKQNPHLRSCTH